VDKGQMRRHEATRKRSNGDAPQRGSPTEVLKPINADRLQMSPDLWTIDDVCKYAGLSRHGVSNMLARGEIPGAIRFGRRWRISKRAFLRALHGEDVDEQETG
jgi:excisionase family DNA binding protein